MMRKYYDLNYIERKGIKIEKSFDKHVSFYTIALLLYEIHYAGVAQWLESLPSKQTVMGSSPITRSI